MSRLEYPVAGNVVPLSPDVFSNTAQQISVAHPNALKQGEEIVRRVCPVWATMVLPARRKRLGQQLLTRVRSVASAALICVTTDVAIRVSDVVKVFRLELLWSMSQQLGRGIGSVGRSSERTVRDELEALAPEYDTLVEAQADALEEQCVL